MTGAFTNKDWEKLLVRARSAGVPTAGFIQTKALDCTINEVEGTLLEGAAAYTLVVLLRDWSNVYAVQRAGSGYFVTRL